MTQEKRVHPRDSNLLILKIVPSVRARHAIAQRLCQQISNDFFHHRVALPGSRLEVRAGSKPNGKTLKPGGTRIYKLTKRAGNTWKPKWSMEAQNSRSLLRTVDRRFTHAWVRGLFQNLAPKAFEKNWRFHLEQQIADMWPQFECRRSPAGAQSIRGLNASRGSPRRPWKPPDIFSAISATPSESRRDHSFS